MLGRGSWSAHHYICGDARRGPRRCGTDGLATPFIVTDSKRCPRIDANPAGQCQQDDIKRSLVPR